MALKIAMFPGPSGTQNSYVRLLAEALGERGHTVAGFAPRADVARSPDVVHVHWPERVTEWMDHPSLPSRLVRFHSALRIVRSRGAILVWTIHNLVPHDLRHRRATRAHLKMFVRQIDGATTLSSGAAQEARLLYRRLQQLPLEVIPHGDYVDAYPRGIRQDEARKRLVIEKDASVVLHLGRLRPYKNVEELLEAFSGLSDPSAKLLVVGQPSSAEFGARLRQLAGDQRIHIEAGYVADDELQVWFAAADLVVLPFQATTHSGSAVLALSFDTPVLTRASHGTEELRRFYGGQRVRLFDGPLTAQLLERELARARRRPPESDPRPRVPWATVAHKTEEFYFRAGASNTRPRRAPRNLSS